MVNCQYTSDPNKRENKEDAGERTRIDASSICSFSETRQLTVGSVCGLHITFGHPGKRRTYLASARKDYLPASKRFLYAFLTLVALTGTMETTRRCNEDVGVAPWTKVIPVGFVKCWSDLGPRSPALAGSEVLEVLQILNQYGKYHQILPMCDAHQGHPRSVHSAHRMINCFAIFSFTASNFSISAVQA